MSTNTSRTQFEKAKNAALKAGVHLLKLTENTSKLLYEATKTAMYGIDGTDKWIGSKIKTNNKYMRMMKNHLLKIALVSGMLVYQGTRSDAPSTPLPDQKQPEKHLVYGIDVSHFNTFDVKKLAAENKRFRDDTDSLTHPKEFIILRATQGEGKYLKGKKAGQNLNDTQFKEYFSLLNHYNLSCSDQNDKIRFATYHLYVTNHDAKKQVENYWETVVATLGEEKAKKQTPILDIEMDDIKKLDEKGRDKLFTDLLEWCKLAEEKFGQKPLIYTSNSAVEDFFRPDYRFDAYQFWVASYGNNDITPAKIQEEGGGNILNANDVALHQFTEKGKVAGMGTQAKQQTDINVMERKDLDQFTNL